MRPIATVALSTALLASGAAPLAAADWAEGMLKDNWLTDLHLLAGARLLDSDWDGGPQTLIGGGVQYQTRRLDWPVGIQVGFTYTQGNEDEDGVKSEIIAREFQFGAYYPFSIGRQFRIDVGAGALVHLMTIEAETTDVVEEDLATVSLYAQVMPHFALTPTFDIGMIARYSYGTADVDLVDEDVNPGGLGLFAAIGMRF